MGNCLAGGSWSEQSCKSATRWSRGHLIPVCNRNPGYGSNGNDIIKAEIAQSFAGSFIWVPDGGEATDGGRVAQIITIRICGQSRA